MRDNLDLKELARQASKATTRSKRNNLFLAIVLILTAVVFISDSSSPTEMYVDTGDGWHGVKGYEGNAVSIQSAPDGTTWLLTSNPISLNRWTGSEWEQNGYNGFRGVSCVCGMAVDPESVWIATDKGAFQFTQGDWKYFPEAIYGRPVAIVTSSFGVYVIDSDRNLSHFDGDKWETRDLRDILPNVTTNQVEKYPQLFAAEDGSIVLQWLGVWHFDGRAWQEVTIEDTPLSRVQLVGTAGNRLWTNWADGLIASDFDGENWVSYEPDEAGIPTSTQIYQVSESADGVQFATSIGLINFDGDTWQNVSPENGEIVGITAAEHNAQGETWIIGAFDRTNAIVLQLLIAICPTVLIITLLVVVFSNGRGVMGQLKVVRERIQELVPDLPAYKKQQPATLLMIFFGAAIGMLLVFGFLGEAQLAIFPILIMIGCIIFTELKKLPPRSDKTRSRTTFKQLVPLIQSVVQLLVLGVGLTLVNRYDSSLNVPFFVGWLLLLIAQSGVQYVRTVNVYHDPNLYETLRREQSAQEVIQSDNLHKKYLYAYSAFVARHLDETETLAKAAIAQAQQANILYLSSSLNLLGLSLMHQKRAAEAMPLIEIAIRLSPTNTPLLNSAAEIYFHEDTDPDRALELTDFTHKYGQASLSGRILGHDYKLINAGLRAWALTKLGRLDEGNALIQHAINRVSTKYHIGIVYLYYMRGKIEEAKGNTAQAAEWFTKASQSDSGLYGQLASKALIELTGGAAPVSASD